jgi:hypothetical protein
MKTDTLRVMKAGGLCVLKAGGLWVLTAALFLQAVKIGQVRRKLVRGPRKE